MDIDRVTHIKIDFMKLVKYFLVILILASCGNNSDVDDTSEDSTAIISDTTFTRLPIRDSAYEVVNTAGYYVWDVDAERKTLRKNERAASITADSVIYGLNKQYDDIVLEKTGFNKDSIHLRIPNSDYFTNQMGSSGAAQYLAQTVINLTSIPGIKFVHIDFKMGSHASPGTWSRKDFPGYIIVQ